MKSLLRSAPVQAALARLLGWYLTFMFATNRWVLDGGVPLVLAYVTAIAFAFFVAWRISADRKEHGLGLWGALLFAYNMAAFAVTFNYPLFIGQSGLEFWLLNAALYGAYRSVVPERAAYPAVRN